MSDLLQRAVASGQVSAAHHAAGDLGKLAVQMPRIIHPEPDTYYLTDNELEAIHAYAQAYEAQRQELEAQIAYLEDGQSRPLTHEQRVLILEVSPTRSKIIDAVENAHGIRAKK